MVPKSIKYFQKYLKLTIHQPQNPYEEHAKFIAQRATKVKLLMYGFVKVSEVD